MRVGVFTANRAECKVKYNTDNNPLYFDGPQKVHGFSFRPHFTLCHKHSPLPPQENNLRSGIGGDF